MKTKREVLEKFKEYGVCEEIRCDECPFNDGFGMRCEIGYTLPKLGAKIMLENGDIGVEQMNIDALLEDYMNNPKWAGKIFMKDEKTCYIDGFNNGVSSYQFRITQLIQQIKNTIGEVE